jgi:NAD(P)H-dependent FMN reductase
MFYIPVILGSIRRNRQSIKVANFAVAALSQRSAVGTELLDLKELNLPMMEERLRFDDHPPSSVSAFSSKINRADSIVIVTPEYNGGCPGVLKNALDYLKNEYRRKPFGIVTVSVADTGGILCLISLRQMVLHLGGVPIPAPLLATRVQELFDSDGRPSNQRFSKHAETFFDELLWFTEALAVQRQKGSSAVTHPETQR